ncbi:hypothetical protein ABZ547_30990 [Streptomyces sparsogenes]|uniref:hypothetical protein n=1 Tax=Streptomyces sparsogenes TaxID=67365 RepID=UPI0033FF1A18
MSARRMLTGTFLGLGALLMTTSALAPAAGAQTAAPEGAAAPVPVTALNCDGNTYKCTANLQYGDGRWVADWGVNVYHQGVASGSSSVRSAAAPVPVTGLSCDGNTYKCTAKLQYGDGRWVADWAVNVYHQGMASQSSSVRSAAAPVPVTGLTCDGNTYKCTANLQYGDGKWVADWKVNVYHQG